MLIRLDNRGTVSIIEADEATYQATQDDFRSDVPDFSPAMPLGFALVTFDTDTGVATGSSWRLNGALQSGQQMIAYEGHSGIVADDRRRQQWSMALAQWKLHNKET